MSFQASIDQSNTVETNDNSTPQDPELAKLYDQTQQLSQSKESTDPERAEIVKKV